MVFNFINISLVPRSLGPVAYGNFEFLLSFFQQITSFIDTGTSSAFYNKLSRRNEDWGLIRAYGKFVLGVFFVMLAGIVLIWWGGWHTKIWPGQEWEFILLAAAVGYVTWVSDVFRKIVDAFGRTIRGELAFVVAKALGTIAVIVLFLASWLSLTTLFVKELLFYGMVISVFGFVANRHWHQQLKASSYSTTDRAVMAELWVYCSPLLVYALAAVFTGVADRWLLQRYAGSEEQGFYALSFRVAGVSLVFTSAMTQLIMREYSRAHNQRDVEETRRLFKRYVPMLYTLTAYLAAFISLQAETVAWFLGGNNFAAAGPALMLMALYPVHQTYGQMNGVLLFATDQTALYRNIGIVAMMTGLVATWVLLAPSDDGGLAAGSVGLAAKMVLVQFVAVNVQLWFNLKSLGLKFRHFFIHQIGVVAGLLTMAWLATTVVGMMSLSRISNFIVAGMVYTALVALAVFKVPACVGSNATELGTFFNKLRRYVRIRR
jgi:O-antigen/teichoic acid export membrane protein